MVLFNYCVHWLFLRMEPSLWFRQFGSMEISRGGDWRGADTELTGRAGT
jgi:hypothetical protein